MDTDADVRVEDRTGGTRHDERIAMRITLNELLAALWIGVVSRVFANLEERRNRIRKTRVVKRRARLM